MKVVMGEAVTMHPAETVIRSYMLNSLQGRDIHFPKDE